MLLLDYETCQLKFTPFLRRLYVVKIKCQETPDVGPTIEEEVLLVMNSTINLKETSQWLENINPEDVLLRDINPCFLPEALPESMMIKRKSFINLLSLNIF